MSELHPLDKLCIASRVQFESNHTELRTFHCSNLEHLCHALYHCGVAQSEMSWWFSIAIEDDPVCVPTRLMLHVPGSIFIAGKHRASVEALMKALRDVYDGEYGPDKVVMGGMPKLSWEDLL